MRTDRILTFLEKIRDNNNRPYFQQHKQDYERAKADFEEITSYLIAELRAADPTLEPMTAKDCTYRFYRDTRFSEDKSPYKRHFGAFIAPHGARRSLLSGYYVHIQPGGSMIATGVYCPEKGMLKKVRDIITNFYDEWTSVAESKELLQTFGKVTSMNKLKRVPLGYPADSEGIEYLKMKDFMVCKNYTDKEVGNNEKFVEQLLTDLKTSIPWNTYLNRIMTD